MHVIVQVCSPEQYPPLSCIPKGLACSSMDGNTVACTLFSEPGFGLLLFGSLVFPKGAAGAKIPKCPF
jgi:hypothetical protein